MLEVDRSVEECRGALRERDARGAVRDVLERAAAHPSDALRGLRKPTRAVIGIYGGQDDNAF